MKKSLKYRVVKCKDQYNVTKYRIEENMCLFGIHLFWDKFIKEEKIENFPIQLNYYPSIYNNDIINISSVYQSYKFSELLFDDFESACQWIIEKNEIQIDNVEYKDLTEIYF